MEGGRLKSPYCFQSSFALIIPNRLRPRPSIFQCHLHFSLFIISSSRTQTHPHNISSNPTPSIPFLPFLLHFLLRIFATHPHIIPTHTTTYHIIIVIIFLITGTSPKSPMPYVPNSPVATAASRRRKTNVARRSCPTRHSSLLTFTRNRRSARIWRCYFHPLAN